MRLARESYHIRCHQKVHTIESMKLAIITRSEPPDANRKKDGCNGEQPDWRDPVRKEVGRPAATLSGTDSGRQMLY